jgi:hypothetical protein
VRPKHVLIEFKKWMCYIDGQKNKYSVLNECNRMLKYNIINIPVKLYLNHGPQEPEIYTANIPGVSNMIR